MQRRSTTGSMRRRSQSEALPGPRRATNTTWTKRSLRVVTVVLTGLVVAAGLTGVGARSALALMPREPILEEEPPWVDEPVFDAPQAGFDWWVPNRFGATETGAGARPGIVDYHWNSDQRPAAHGGPMYTYDPAYVHAGTLTANFSGCQTEDELTRSATNSTAYRYSWALQDPGTGDLLPAGPGESNPTPPLQSCRWSKVFDLDPATGIGPTTRVVLSITDPSRDNAAVPGSPYQQDVTVRDILIVSLGDSYGSGEGNPDIPRGEAEEGQWVDVRCHRSVAASAAQAALSLERADPHSSVTFLSFACSGATIEAVTSKNESPLDPYAPTDGTQRNGSGVLGPYRGVAPSPAIGFDGNDVGYRADADYLPSQVTQMYDAVTTRSYNGGEHVRGIPRKIDRLIASAGGNDMGFARVAMVCLLSHQCRYKHVTNANVSGTQTLEERVAEDVARLNGQYDNMASAINNTGLDIEKLAITEYPDVARNDSGAPCGSILYDVFPAWVQVLGVLAVGVVVALLAALPVLGPVFAAMSPAALGAIVVNGVFPPFAMNNDPVFGNEVDWASSSIAPALATAVADAASEHAGDRVPWHVVSGVADRYRNANGVGHGYCANPATSWIRTASDSTVLQGPPGLVNTGTTGTLHPTAAGLKDTGNLIFAQQLADLVTAPSPSPPSYAVDYGKSTTGADGWLTGCVGLSCVANSPVVNVSVQDGDGILAAGLLVDGVRRACGGETVAGVMCSASGGGGRYEWSLRFTSSGARHLSFDTVSQRDERKTLALDVKVDKENPTVAPASLAAAPRSGWYRGPVDITFDGADAAGASNLKGIEYRIDGGPTQLVAAASQLSVGIPISAAQAQLAADGNHTLEYWAVDGAGRTSARQDLALKIDATPPVVACGGADGAWHASDVSIACTGSDATSGLAATGDADFSLSTGVADGDETANAATGVRNVCDVAGNCVDAGPVAHNRIDKKAPAIAIDAPAGPYVFGQSVAADYSCTDGGSGLASCVGTVANGANVDTASVGSKTFAVTSADALGHESSQSVTYQVDKAATATTVTPDVNPTVFGQPMTLTATVAAVAPGAGVPSGVAQFRDGATDIGGPLTLAGGTVAFSTSALAVGSHTITAVYGGDGNFLDGTSVAVTQVVNKAATNTTLTSDANPSMFGQPVTFTATVAAVAPGAGVPGGSVQFRNGGADLGPPVPVVNGVATFRAGMLTGGDRSITAVYSGDGSFLESAGAHTQQVTAANVLSGDVKGPLTLTVGTWFLDGVVLTGDLRVGRGAAVSIRGSRISGAMVSDQAAVIAVCRSEIGGRAAISATSGFVLLGDPGDDDCEGNTFHGMTVVKDNRGGVEIADNAFRGGLVVDGNSGTGPLPEHSGTEIEANTISGQLSCTLNSPAPTNDGRPNTADAKRGECSSPTF